MQKAKNHFENIKINDIINIIIKGGEFMTKRYIVSIDAGTTSVRTSLFDVATNSLVRIRGSNISQSYPHNGWVDQDAEEIWNRISENLSKTLRGISQDEIFGIGITNQRETVVMWDKKTGKPITPAICWQCKRTEEYCKSLYKDKNIFKLIQQKTGLIVNSYFSASKIKWMLDNVYNSVRLYKQNRLCCGTLDSYLVFRLTKGKRFVTEPSNASRTMLFNIYTGEWDDELLNLFGIPKDILPEVVDSNAHIADIKFEDKIIPLGGILGDQQASLMGQACFDEGNIKNTYGTGSFLLLNLGSKSNITKTKMLTTVAWRLNGKQTYALEGSVYNAGACVSWMKESAKLIKEANESEFMALSVDNSLGVKFVPAFNGLGAPFWNDGVRAGFFDITQGATKEHLVRAVLESVANSVRAVMDQMEIDANVKINDIRVDGGMSVNNFFVQYQSDVLNKQIYVASEPESTSLGAAYIAGLTFGAFENFDDIRQLYKIGKIFKPSKRKNEADKEYQEWIKLVQNLVKLEEMYGAKK